MNPHNKERLTAAWRFVAILAMILAGPIIICGSLWYAHNLLPPPAPEQTEPSGTADAGSDPDAGEVADAEAVSARPIIPVIDSLPDEGHPEAVMAAAQKTVPLRAAFNNGETGIGTGFIYAPGVIVTAAHIIDAHGAENLTGIVVYCDGANNEAGVMAVDLLRDTAVLAANCDAEPMAVSAKQPRAADPLYVTGFNFSSPVVAAIRYLRPTRARPKAVITARPPDLLDPRISRMITEAAKQNIPRLRAIDVLLAPGNSGSPVLRADGTIVGMAVISDRLQNLTFIVPAANLRHVLRQAGVE